MEDVGNDLRKWESGENKELRQLFNDSYKIRRALKMKEPTTNQPTTMNNF